MDVVKLMKHVRDHPKNDAFLGFYDVITRPDWQDYEWDLDWTLHHRSVYEFAREQGLLSGTAVAELAEIDAFWRAHPDAFERAFGTLIRRIDPAKELEGWVEDGAGRPAPIPPSHWWWRLPKEW